jgi:hypothetical protein
MSKDKKTKDKVKVEFIYNGKQVPIRSDVTYKWLKNDVLSLKFSMGNQKIDNVELKFTSMEDVQELKQDEKNTNNN